MSDASGAPHLVTVKCEKHGLRYNPNLQSGCVRCRKEAGAPIAPPAGTPARAASPPAGAGGSVIPALAVAVLLVVATGSGFYFAHRQLSESFGDVFAEPTSGEDSYDENSYDEDSYSDEEPDFPDEMGLTPEERE